jgi:ribosomal protein S18 acetylase RimI-like enzyme
VQVNSNQFITKNFLVRFKPNIMLKIDTLHNVTFDEIAATFNAAFSDYFLPIVFTKEQLEDKFINEGGRLDLSVGVFEDNKLVAFILHFSTVANGGIVVYNGGTGVTPNYRGNHLTLKMYAFIMPKLLANKVDKTVLEVLTINLPAIKIYQNQGFSIVRELNCFKGKLSEIKQKEAIRNYEVVKLKELDWKILQSFWDYPPTWQNSIPVMDKLLAQNMCLGITQNDTIRGYVIYNPKIRRIHHLAVDKNFRNRGLGSHLLNAIFKIEKEEISFLNIDSRNKVFTSLLEKMGFNNYTNQYEMELKLNHNYR